MLTPIAKGMLAVSVIFPVLAGILVALRFTARRVKNVRAQADDWMIVLAEVFCIGLGINTIIGVSLGAVGVPRNELNRFQAVSLLKVIYADSFLCFTSETIVKISILLFYRRIFTTPRFRGITNLLLFAVVAWEIAAVLVLFFSQTPFSNHWNPVSDAGLRVDFSAFLMSHAALDLAFDVIILCLPFPMIEALQLKPRRKLGLVGIFCLGFFCVVSEAVRIFYFNKFLFTNLTGHSDAFGSTVANILIWSRIEPCCSVIAACLLTLGPLVRGGRTPESLIRSIRSYFTINRSSSTTSLANKRDRLPSEDNHSSRTGESNQIDSVWTVHGSNKTVIQHDDIPLDQIPNREPSSGITVQKGFMSE